MLTKEDRIKTVYGGGGHVVILGAGASIASTLRNPEKGGKILPSMDNFIKVLGLQDLIKKLPQMPRVRNFEKIYGKLYTDDPKSDIVKMIDARVRDYFGDMSLPDEPTIYDYLVLSLRNRDLIATFNWDPFLYQAFCRNSHLGEMPYLTFLHGNVAVGYNSEEKRAGPANGIHKITYRSYEPTQLLFPVEQKNYNQDEFITMEWDKVKFWLSDKNTKLVTIFGYSAPKTDVEAVKLLNDAWGTGDKREMEQFEIIDTKPENVVRKKWDSFIHTHHYDYTNDFFHSSLALNPRRTSESYFQHITPLTPSEAFSKSNPVPSDFSTLQELWEWFKPLIDAENEWKSKQSPDE
jgi:hypothetical protein